MPQSDETRIAVISTDIGYIKQKMDSIEKKLEEMTNQYISRVEFDGFKNGEYRVIRYLVFGCALMILTAVVGRLLGKI